jgi:cytidylate kinase
MDLFFDNIAISGGVACGKGTLQRNLKTYLEPMGWEFRSTGQIIRDYTKENVLPLATMVSEDFDRKVENSVGELFQTKTKLCVEGWLAGFVARELDNTLRVLLICSNEALRVDRVANRDKVTIEEAKHNIKVREEENFKKWQKLYGDHNFFDPAYYHLVIDTYSSGQMETVGKVLDKIGYKK